MSLVVLVAAESPAADLLGLWHIISIASALPGLQTKSWADFSPLGRHTRRVGSDQGTKCGVKARGSSQQLQH